MAKDKKKGKKSKGGKSARTQSPSVAERFKAISENPAVAEFVSSALLATAAALKDASRVRRVASEAGGELSDLVKEGAERGHELWEMALQVGRRSLDNLTDGNGAKKRTPAKRTAAKRTAAKRPAAKHTAAKRTPARKKVTTRAPSKKTTAKAPARKAQARPAARRAAAKTIAKAPARASAKAAARKAPTKARKPAARKPAARKPAARKQVARKSAVLAPGNPASS